MATQYRVSVTEIIEKNSLELVYTPNNTDDIFIVSKDVNRPGLALAGYMEYFDSERVEFLGRTEFGYLESKSEQERHDKLERFFSQRPSLVVVTRNIEIPDDMIELVKKYSVPLLRSPISTSSCMADLISYLNVELAQRITRHGVMVEVSGEGILILGNSGVGKSETALELIRRGHRLIADDAVEIRRVSGKTLVGSAPDNIRHFIELRGVGVINARRLFGMGAVKNTEKIDLVIQLEPWDQNKVYERMGLDDEYVNILGIDVPVTVVPVKPGRNLSIIIEAAAMNSRQKKMGYNAPRELLKKLGMDDQIQPTKRELEIWGE